jgi:EmrB/QacA subfamily drug resistance transporter
MLYRAYSMEDRAKAAIGVLSVAVIAPAIGPMLGGILVDSASWHWIFLINGPIGAVAIVLSVMWLEETKHETPGRFDLAGFVLSAASVAILLYTLSIGPEKGWFSAYTITFAVVGIACLVALIVIELRIPNPILMLRLFHDRLFRTVNISAGLTYAGFFGMIFVLPLYLQSLRGYTAFQSGLAQSPQAIGVFLVSNLLGRRLYRAVGPRRLMVVGTAATSAITCLYATADLDTPLSTIAGFSFMRGLAVGMVFVSIQTAAYATTSMADTGRATSLKHPAPDRLRPRAALGLPGRIPRGRADHGARHDHLVVHRRRRRRRHPRADSDNAGAADRPSVTSAAPARTGLVRLSVWCGRTS